MADQFKNFMIGLFIAIAAVVVVFILMFLHPHVGDQGKQIKVRFTDVDKVTPGTRVTYAGKPVGEVVSIEEVDTERKEKTDSLGRIYLYQLTLKVDSHVNVFNSDEIALRTSGLLGEKNVEITPMAPKTGVPLKNVDDQILYSIETSSVEDTLKEFKKFADRFELALDRVNGILGNVQKDQIVDKISQTLDHVVSITNALDLPKDLSATVVNLHTLTDKAIHSWDTVDKVLANFYDVTSNAKEITDKVKSGQGTLGKLIVKDDMYLRINSLMSKLEVTMDDINHYGLMFHSDKGWQRLRARRLNLMQTLKRPEEFRNYFNDEVDQITASLSRVYSVLDQVGDSPYCGNMLQNPEFAKVYKELIRRVGMFEEEIRMYNTQIVENEVHKTELGPSHMCPSTCDGILSNQ